MATESAIAYVTVAPSARGFGKKLEQQIQPSALGASVGSKMSGSFLASAGKMAARTTAIVGGSVAAIGAGIAGIAAKKGLDRLLNIDDAQGKLKGLGNSTKQIATIMDSALASVKGTAFGLGDAATVASNAVAAGIKPGQDLTKYLTLTADAASIAGVSLDEMGSIINKTTTSGKVYTDNLNQLADRGIPIFTWLQKEYGVSADELSSMVSKGKVDAETFRKVIQENIGGAALASGNTVRGAYANMGAALGRLGAMFLAGPVAAAPELFGALTGAVDRAGEALKPFADRFDEFISIKLYSLEDLVQRIDLGKLIDGFKAITQSSPLVTVLRALEPLLPVIAGAVRQLAPLVLQLAQTFGSALSSAITALLPAIAELLPIAVALAEQFGTALLQALIALAPAIVIVADVLASIVGFLAKNEALTTSLAVAVLGGVVAFKLYSGALTVWSVATKVAAGAQRIFNLALKANPIGLIITAVAALVAGLVWFFTQTKLGRAIVENVFNAIKVAVAAVGAAFVWLWENAIKPAWDGIAAGASWLWTTVLQPVFTAIANVVKVVVGVIVAYVKLWVGVFTTVGTAIGYLWSNYVSPVFELIGAIFGWLWNTIIAPTAKLIAGIIVDGIGAAFSWLWTTIIRPVFGWIGSVFSAWWATTSTIFGAVVGFVRNTLGAVFSWLYNTIIKPVFAWIASVISAWWTGVQAIFGRVVFFIQGTLGVAFTAFYNNVIRPVWNGIKTVISNVWNNGIKPVFDKVVDVVKNTVPKAFNTMKDAIGKAWDAVKSAAKAPIKFVVETVINDGIIKNFNKVAGFFKTKKIPEVALPKGFATGGYTGSGGKYDPAGIVHAGEFVFTKEQTARLGVGRLYDIARNGYAKGGFVSDTKKNVSAGWDWLAGKAGKAWDWTKNAAETAKSIVSDPTGTLGKLVKGIIGTIPGAGGVLELAKGVGNKLLSSVIDKLKGIGDGAGVFGGNGQNGQIPSSALSKASGFAPGPGVGAIGGLLRKSAAAAWDRAYAASGGALRLTEGYRDLKAQQYRWSLYKNGGNLAAAPGTSIHGFGLAADVAGGQAWLRANGAKYGWVNTGLGFSQREPWHFEFKGMKNVPQLANGAYIKRSVGGSLVNVGEGRYDEAVVPLTPAFKDALAQRPATTEGGPIIGQLSIVSSGNLRNDLDEVTHRFRALERGGRRR